MTSSLAVISSDLYALYSGDDGSGINVAFRCPHCRASERFSPRWSPHVNETSAHIVNSRCGGCSGEIIFLRFICPTKANTTMPPTRQYYVYPNPFEEGSLVPELQAGASLPSGVKAYYSKVRQAAVLEDSDGISLNCRIALEGILKEKLKCVASNKSVNQLIKNLRESGLIEEVLEELFIAIKDRGNKSAHYRQDGPLMDKSVACAMAQATALAIDFFYATPELTLAIKTDDKLQ